MGSYLRSNEADLEIVSRSNKYQRWYSVVYDSARSIVYDHFRYFVSPDVTAEDVLKESTPATERKPGKTKAPAPKRRKKIKGSGPRRPQPNL